MNPTKTPTTLKVELKALSSNYKNEGEDFRAGCPACQKSEYKYAFQIEGFHYVQCSHCSTIYVQNPPKGEIFDSYQKDIAKIFQSKEYLDYIQELNADSFFHLEITFNKFMGSKKSAQVGVAGFKNPAILDKLSEILVAGRDIEIVEYDSTKKNHYDFIILDHCLERELDPLGLIESCYESLNSRGYLYATARAGSGIDILACWEKSSIIPLEHLNLISVEGFKELIKDFKILELSTPGSMDISFIRENDLDALPQLFKYIVSHRDEKTFNSFQQFIQKNLLSSHLVLVANKGSN